MRVLTVFAHSGSRSFCHAVLERFDAGLKDAGHTHEVVDLYAIGFDPVLRASDAPNWMDADAPDDIIASMHLRERLLEGARGPLRRFAMKRLLGDRDTRAIVRLLQERYRPKDVLEQQEKVRQANALAFIAPVLLRRVPSHIEGLDRARVHAGIRVRPHGRRLEGGPQRPRAAAHPQKALIMQSTIFDQRAYDSGLRDAMQRLVDEFCLRYPGVKRVEREYSMPSTARMM